MSKELRQKLNWRSKRYTYGGFKNSQQENSIIYEGATLDEGTAFCHFSHVCAGAIIGVGAHFVITSLSEVGWWSKATARSKTTFRSMTHHLWRLRLLWPEHCLYQCLQSESGEYPQIKKIVARESAKEQPWEPTAMWSLVWRLDAMRSLVPERWTV